MRLNNTLRSFLIAILISLVAIFVEAAYYGLHPKQLYNFNDTMYSISSPFVNNFTDLSSPLNLIILGAIFIGSFLMASNILSKKNRL